MHRIDGDGAVEGAWVAEDVVLGRQPTLITPDIMNALQEELATLIEWAGLELNKGDNTQLLQALMAKFVLQGEGIDGLAAHLIDTDAHPGYATISLLATAIAANTNGKLLRSTILTTGSGTWTKLVDTQSVLIRAVGGGGGGGAYWLLENGYNGGAGGDAGYAEKYIATAASSYAYSVGAGGVSASIGGTNGSSGGSTTIAGITAGGGAGGVGGSITPSNGADGTSTGGDLNVTGHPAVTQVSHCSTTGTHGSYGGGGIGGTPSAQAGAAGVGGAIQILEFAS